MRSVDHHYNNVKHSEQYWLVLTFTSGAVQHITTKLMPLAAKLSAITEKVALSEIEI